MTEGGPIAFSRRTNLGVIMTAHHWLAGLMGMSAGNSKLKQFEADIEKGELLVLLDIPLERIEDIKQKILKHHPAAEFGSIEPFLPLPRE